MIRCRPRTRSRLVVTERVDVGLELLFLDEADSVDEEIVDAGEIFGGTG